MLTQTRFGSLSLGSNPISAKATLALAALASALLAAAPAKAQATTCATAGAEVNHDSDLAADCAAGVCVERVCVDTLYRRAILCGHGFSGAPTVMVGGQSLPVLSSAAGACGATDESMVVSLDDCNEGQHKLVVYNVGKKSEPFFIKVGELAGPQGPAGATGPQGIAGPTGPAGALGPQGVPGFNGINGIDGVQGPPGAAGATGPQGARGDTGPQGIAGAAGNAGAAGPTGAQGATGPKGDKGDTGPQGIAGATGNAGATGPTGAQGATGPKGDKGDTGPMGTPGLNGASGATGPAGPTGTSNLSLATPLYTVHPSCSGPGAITLAGVCSYAAPAVQDPNTGIGGGCFQDGQLHTSTVATFSTPSCAAACATSAAMRTVCSQYQTQGCTVPFGARSCQCGAATCVQQTTVTDLACDCTNTSLGSLVR